MRIVALAPMRHQSERVPNKNFRHFAGYPLYHHIIKTLSACPQIDEIVIDTDSPIIMADAAKHFPHTRRLERPEHLRAGTIPMNDVLMHDTSLIKADFYLQTHSTNPLLSAKALEEGIKTYFSMPDEFDSVFSVTRWQTRLYWSSDEPINHNPEELIRTQDLSPVFEENSSFYIFSKTSFKRADNRRIGLKPKMFVMDKIEAIDIDEEPDFSLAEIIYRMKHV